MKNVAGIRRHSESRSVFRFLLSSRWRALNRLAVLPGMALLLFNNVCGGALIYWDCDTTASTSISGSDAAGIASAVFADPAANQSTTTTLISGTSASSGYTGASGGNNFESDARVGALSTSSSTYFSVTLTPNAGYTITLGSVSLGSRSTGTGPVTITLYSSIDNYASAIGSASVLANSSWALSSITFSGSSLTGAAGTDITLKIYGSDGAGTQPSSANWRMDDINFTVTLASVPESDWLGLMAGAGLFGVCAQHLWRQRRLHNSPAVV